MENSIFFLSGFIHKLYDDFSDNNEQISSQIIELIKVLMVCLMTISFMLDIGLSSFFVIITMIYWCIGKVDNEFWKACIPIPIITTLINLDKFEFVGFFDLFQRLIFVTILSISMIIEDKAFPEEISETKISFRIITFFVGLLVIYLTQTFSSRKFIHSMLFFILGYILSNLSYHLFKPYTASNIT